MPDQPAERVRSVLERVLEELDLDGEVETSEDEEEIVAVVDGDDDFGLLIGRHGQTIDALQLLCYQAAFRGIPERKRVMVDAAGYRERRREALFAEIERAIPGRSGSVSAEYDVTLGYPNAISLGSNIPDMGTSESVTNFQKTT